MSQGIQTEALSNLGGWNRMGRWEEGSREGTYVCLWLIHVDISQKTTKFCKAIIFQLKNK